MYDHKLPTNINQVSWKWGKNRGFFNHSLILEPVAIFMHILLGYYSKGCNLQILWRRARLKLYEGMLYHGLTLDFLFVLDEQAIFKDDKIRVQ